MFRLLIFGYYKRGNFGDDLFEYIFKNFIFNDNEFDLTIANIDDFQIIVNQKEIEQYDTVIFGGGDIINNYFFTPENIATIRTVFKNVKVIFFGVGISFLSTLPLLDQGDYFFIRNKPDYETVKYRFGPKYSFFIPDLAYKLVGTLPSQYHLRTSIIDIGVCLPYTWFSDTSKNNYKFFHQICSIITKLSKTYNVHLIPFDTSKNQSNSDLILHNNIQKVVSEYNEYGQQCVFFHKGDQTISQMIELYSKLDVIIGGRYHSIVLSVITKTPFLALHSTRKLENMKHELPSVLSHCFLPLQLDSDFVPINIDTNDFDQRLDYVISQSDMIKDAMGTACNNLKQMLDSQCSNVISLIKMNAKTRSAPPCHVSDEERNAIIDEIITKVEELLPKSGCFRINYKTKLKKLLYNGESIKNCFINKRGSSFSNITKTLTEEILWIITGDPYGPYYYGLSENIVTQPLLPQINWIIDDYYFRFKYNSKSAVLVINKNFQELHRSGWQYIVDNIVSNLSSSGSDFILDTYVDKTFHWNKDFYTSKSIIPYKSAWIGFIHHTFSNYNNKYNCTTLFQSPTFIESLETCKCLIVMSQALKRQIDTKLDSLTNLQNKPQVCVIYHPSEETQHKFVWDQFILQKSRPVVQIGNWLRNVFAIYKLEIPNSSIVTEKAILKNRNSENYFLPPWFFEKFEELISSENSIPVLDMCRLNFDNMHLKGMYDHLVSAENSVTIIEHLNNEEYDKLLATSIVFIQLVDASAVNTVIECILRNTPIIVNPIDAVVEVLGPDYPLYYTTMYEASQLIENSESNKIKAAHDYLKAMNKSKFLISTFTSEFTNILSEVL
jgi:polysaccharide pyruvyl transferase WcaK-like protein